MKTIHTRANQLLTMYSRSTPPELFDLRCEYEVPRYVDLNSIEEEDSDCMQGGVTFDDMWPAERKQSTTGGAQMQQVTQEEEFFQWF